jgi:hypothetical protein
MINCHGQYCSACRVRPMQNFRSQIVVDHSRCLHCIVVWLLTTPSHSSTFEHVCSILLLKSYGHFFLFFSLLHPFYEFKCLSNKQYLLELEVLTAVVMKSSIFWDITPRSPLKVNKRFRGTYRLHLQCRRVNRTCFHCRSFYATFLLGLSLDREDRGDLFLRNVD